MHAIDRRWLVLAGVGFALALAGCAPDPCYQDDIIIIEGPDPSPHWPAPPNPDEHWPAPPNPDTQVQTVADPLPPRHTPIERGQDESSTATKTRDDRPTPVTATPRPKPDRDERQPEPAPAPAGDRGETGPRTRTR